MNYKYLYLVVIKGWWLYIYDGYVCVCDIFNVFWRDFEVVIFVNYLKVC